MPRILMCGSSGPTRVPVVLWPLVSFPALVLRLRLHFDDHGAGHSTGGGNVLCERELGRLLLPGWEYLLDTCLFQRPSTVSRGRWICESHGGWDLRVDEFIRLNLREGNLWTLYLGRCGRWPLEVVHLDNYTVACNAIWHLDNMFDTTLCLSTTCPNVDHGTLRGLCPRECGLCVDGDSSLETTTALHYAELLDKQENDMEEGVINFILFLR